MTERQKILEDSFRELRAAWFVCVLYTPCHEREWEGEDRKWYRKGQNDGNRERFNVQTEQIIRGEVKPVCPRCLADLD